MDPFSLGLTSIAGAQNPELLASLLAQAGQVPPLNGSPMQYYPPVGVSLANQQPQVPVIPWNQPGPGEGGQTPVGAWNTTTTPEQQSQAGATAKPGLSPFSGIQKPTVPQPDMKAGVAGAGTPPKMGAPGNSQVATIMQQLFGKVLTPQALPTLGALLKG